MKDQITHSLFVPTGKEVQQKSMQFANAVALELIAYGIEVDPQILERISTLDPDHAQSICNGILKKFTIGDINRPLFDQWEERTEFTFQEFVVQILGYSFQISGNDLYDPSFMQNLLGKVEITQAKKLVLQNNKEAQTEFINLVNATVSLEKDSWERLVELSKVYFALAPRRIQSDQARTAILLGMVQSGFRVGDAMSHLSCQPSDSLRYAACKKDPATVVLPSDVLYANLGWKERISVFEFLGTFAFEDLCESMGNNRSAWTRFVKHTHLLSQRDFRNRFPLVAACAFASCRGKSDSIPGKRIAEQLDKHSKFLDITPEGNFVFRTFASRVQMAVENKDFGAFETEVGPKPTYLLRNIASLSQVCTDDTAEMFLELVRGAIKVADAGVLFSLAQIDTKAEFRIIDSKGNTTVVPADYHPVISDVVELAEKEISRRFALDGQVLVEEKLKTRIVPFLAKNSELDRGSKISFSDSKYLYFLIHWVQQKNRRTDLDHSFVCFDESWTPEFVYFASQANSYIAQSGDITNAPAPHGGTEYSRIDLNRIPKHIQYIVPIVNVYAGDVFSNNETAYAGFMFSDNKKFSISTEHVRYDLSEPAHTNIPFVMDIKNREIMIVDFNNRQRNGMTAHDSVTEIRKLISALETKRFMSIQRFANLFSGDSTDVSLTICEQPDGESEINPSQLPTLLQSKKKQLAGSEA